MMKIEKGDICSSTSYFKVENVGTDDKGEPFVSVKDVFSGVNFRVEGEELIASFNSSSDFDDKAVVILSKTALAQKFWDIDDKPFTASFEKKDGTVRELKGKKANAKGSAILGYSLVIDLETDIKSHRERNVNHNTLLWFICDGIKYSLKGLK